MRRSQSIWATGFLFLTRVRVGARTEGCAIRAVFLALLLTAPALALPRSLRKAAQEITHAKLDTCLPAIEALERSKDRSAVPVLAAALATERRPLVRRYLVDALGRLADPSAASALKTALRDADPSVRQSAVVALSTIGGTDVDEALATQAAAESDIAVQAALAQSFSRSKHPKAKDQLRAYRASGNSELRRIAQEASDRSGGKATK
jgi:HEAT repeat protein